MTAQHTAAPPPTGPYPTGSQPTGPNLTGSQPTGSNLTGSQPTGSVPAGGLRHPDDPDPVRSTKATTVYVLGIVAVLTGPFVGGLIPATIALLLARQARAELEAAQGYLMGSRRYERGVSLAWTGIVLALAAIVVAVIRGLYLWAATGGGDIDPTVQ